MGVFKKIEAPNKVVLIIGSEGSGKTHFGTTAPGPIYMIGTEGGHEKQTAFDINPEILHAPIYSSTDTSPIAAWFGRSFELWKKLEEASRDLMVLQPGTVIIDSASDMYPMAVAGLNEELKRGDKAVPSLLYGQIYGMCSAIISNLRQRHNIIMTGRVKPKYVNDKETEDVKADVWRTAPFLAEHFLRIEQVPGSSRRIAYVMKGPHSERVVPDPTWENVVEGKALDFPTTVEYDNLLARWNRAKEIMSQLGMQYEVPVLVTAKEISDELTKIKQQLKQKQQEAQPQVETQPSQADASPDATLKG